MTKCVLVVNSLNKIRINKRRILFPYDTHLLIFTTEFGRARFSWPFVTFGAGDESATVRDESLRCQYQHHHHHPIWICFVVVQYQIYDVLMRQARLFHLAWICNDDFETRFSLVLATSSISAQSVRVPPLLNISSCETCTQAPILVPVKIERGAYVLSEVCHFCAVPIWTR